MIARKVTDRGVMGDRYIIQVECEKCLHTDDDVYFAPTCGFENWTCPKCKHVMDLYEYTGMSYEDCSNIGLIKTIAGKVK